MKAPSVAEPGLYRIRQGRTLFVPGVKDLNNRIWAGAGQYVDLTNPVAASLTEGQAYKLERVDKIIEGRGLNPIVPQKIQQAIRDRKLAAKGETPPTKVEEQANAGGVKVDELPGLDEPEVEPVEDAAPGTPIDDEPDVEESAPLFEQSPGGVSKAEPIEE